MTPNSAEIIPLLVQPSPTLVEATLVVVKFTRFGPLPPTPRALQRRDPPQLHI